MLPHIYSDWNRTLIKNPDDTPLLKKIGEDELFGSSIRPWRWGKAIDLLYKRKRLKEMVAEFRENPSSHGDLICEMYDIYGQAIAGTPMERIGISIDKYADSAVSSLDDAFYELCNAYYEGCLVTILTSALEPGIIDVIMRTKGPPTFLADGSRILDYDGVAGGIALRNYSDRAERLKSILPLYRDFHRIVFMGDDSKDDPCADVADVFVVAPLAEDTYRQHMSNKYGRKVRAPSAKKDEVYKALILD